MLSSYRLSVWASESFWKASPRVLIARKQKLNNTTLTTPKEVNHLVGIVVSENEPIDRALKRFKKKYERSGVLKEFKKRAYFTKPSVKKRMKKVKAIRRAQRSLAEQT